ncbi:hypothetical protein D3C59_37370 [Streptomyces sp. SHP22-7]|nr:hypothetical protein D3C59_37370 [Streptomyces sp. SHP22-7]
MNGNRVGVGLRERLYVSTTATFDPDNDLDFIAIEYALNGEPVKLTTAEKIYAARLLDERAMDFKNIGRRVGLTRPRSVVEGQRVEAGRFTSEDGQVVPSGAGVW